MQVTSSTSAPSSATNTLAAATNKALTQEDFLNLLVKQMTTQDPMNPQSNTDFAAQMAQFSALQTSQSTSTSIAALRTQQDVLQATSLLGTTVTLQPDSNSNNTTQGVVSAVQLNAGTPSLVVNGQSYTLDKVVTVTPTTVSQ